MSDSCPKCGSAIELASRPVTVRTGKCTSCEANYTFLEGTEEISIPNGGGASTVALEIEPGSEGEEDGDEESTLKCSKCGGDLELSIGAGNSIEATCTECENEQRYVLEGTGRPPRGGDEGGGRSWGRSDRSGPGGPGGPAGPSARPCRECGGALKFTTLPDGMVQGECTSCGNKFVLPPRRDDRRGGGDRGRGGYGGRSNYRSGGGGGGRYGGRGGGGGGYRGKRREYGDRSERPRRRTERDE